ncbi:MAG: hypothetical protein D6680_17850, partial [Cyanobacteria bacterium J007]
AECFPALGVWEGVEPQDDPRNFRRWDVPVGVAGVEWTDVWIVTFDFLMRSDSYQMQPNF